LKEVAEKTMDLTTILREVDSWPIDDRIQLVEAIWDRIVDSGEQCELTHPQQADLDCRLADLEAAPDDLVSWDEITEYVRRPR
jgi:putative addiction module component (TIGR02574 family)